MPFDPREIIKAAEDAGQNAIYGVKTAIEDRRNKRYWTQYYKDAAILRPVFEKDVQDGTFNFPKMIIIADPDEKHLSNDCCKESIGNIENSGGLEILRIYPECQSKFLLHFVGNVDDIFYVDEFRKNYYVGIQNYFFTIQKARVRELENLAYSLGAKSITIEEKHKESRYSSINAEAKAQLGKKKKKKQKDEEDDNKSFSAEVIINKEKSKVQEGKILASNTWVGNDDPHPIDLVYFKDDETIHDLNDWRLDDKKRNAIKSKTYTISYSDSLGIKAKDAAKIDAALKNYGSELSGKFGKDYRTELLNYFSFTISF